MAVGIDEGRSKSSDDLGNEYQGTQNIKTTGSYNVGDDEAVEKQDNTLTLRFIEKRNMEKTSNCAVNSQQRNNWERLLLKYEMIQEGVWKRLFPQCVA